MRADRVISMMFLLSNRGRMTARELAEELEVSERTVLRDIEALGAAGVPVFSRRGRGGGFEIWDGFRPHLSSITGNEAAALAMLGIPQIARSLGLGDAARSVRAKLLEAVPPELANEMATMTSRFHHDAEPWERPSPQRTLTFLATAVHRRREIRTRLSETVDLVLLEPLGLVLKAGEWFLVADMSDDRQVVAVEDLSRYETTGRRFPYPEDFDLAQYWTGWASGSHPGRD